MTTPGATPNRSARFFNLSEETSGVASGAETTVPNFSWRIFILSVTGAVMTSAILITAFSPVGLTDGGLFSAAALMASAVVPPPPSICGAASGTGCRFKMIFFLEGGAPSCTVEFPFCSVFKGEDAERLTASAAFVGDGSVLGGTVLVGDEIVRSAATAVSVSASPSLSSS